MLFVFKSDILRKNETICWPAPYCTNTETPSMMIEKIPCKEMGTKIYLP